MNVFYEEEGGFKVGAVLADNNTSLQVEAPHGKRAKVKASAVILRFDAPGIADFMERAQKLAAELDPNFLWECCGEEEFGFEGLARDYYGHAPDRVEAAGCSSVCTAHPCISTRRAGAATSRPRRMR